MFPAETTPTGTFTWTVRAARPFRPSAVHTHCKQVFETAQITPVKPTGHSKLRSFFPVQVVLYGRAAGVVSSEPQQERLGKLSFVDLAGSERAARTGNVGARLK